MNRPLLVDYVVASLIVAVLTIIGAGVVCFTTLAIYFSLI